jgi:hypothetical protein
VLELGFCSEEIAGQSPSGVGIHYLQRGSALRLTGWGHGRVLSLTIPFFCTVRLPINCDELRAQGLYVRVTEAFVIERK